MTPEEQKQIEDARIVETFLKDPVIMAAKARVEAKMFAQFQKPDADDRHLRNTWALAQALDALWNEFAVVTSNGDSAKHKRGQEEAKAELEAERVKRFRR